MRADTIDPSQAILVLAPVGRDADMAVSVLRTAGIAAQPFRSLSELCEHLQTKGDSVGALMLTEEALASSNEYSSLVEWIEHQEPWSQLPVVFLTHPGQPTKVTGRRSRVLGLRGAVSIL
jgi:hypothetical protein